MRNILIIVHITRKKINTKKSFQMFENKIVQMSKRLFSEQLTDSQTTVYVTISCSTPVPADDETLTEKQ